MMGCRIYLSSAGSWGSCPTVLLYGELRPYDGLPTFLGRPWKNHSSTVIFMHCLLQDIIHNPAGWESWNSSVPVPDTMFYGEFQNRGDGAKTEERVDWPAFHVITDPASPKLSRCTSSSKSSSSVSTASYGTCKSQPHTQRARPASASRALPPLPLHHTLELAGAAPPPHPRRRPSTKPPPASRPAATPRCCSVAPSHTPPPAGAPYPAARRLHVDTSCWGTDSCQPIARLRLACPAHRLAPPRVAAFCHGIAPDRPSSCSNLVTTQPAAPPPGLGLPLLH
ncbi:hypothetical protein C2845_PM16G05540 [Panicum miliaceum]|uniref:Pectinesterase catalytic domain-containing protein n=1 Tax=Panicum miliaceum TaxID=4540 RepID=A0A3L6Q021_PANMI|nr:hypothetical protein C2845_PM16G05540 [Panicum miliaceum]